MQLQQSFEIANSIPKVWAAFEDLAATASCIPGAEIKSVKDNRVAEGLFRVQLGPIKAAFAGEAEILRNDEDRSGTITGAGRDGKNSTRVKATVDYKLVAVSEGSTRVDLNVDYTISGPLAQFARTSIVKEVAASIIKMFAGNLERMLSAQALHADAAQEPDGTVPVAAEPAQATSQGGDKQQSINLLAVIFSTIWRRITGALRGTAS